MIILVKFITYFVGSLGFLGLLVSGQAIAVENSTPRSGISISSGYGASDIVPIRIGMQQYWNRSWRNNDTWGFSGYWEGSLYHLQGRRDKNRVNSNKSLQAIALAGVLRYERNEPIKNSFYPYFDVGFGASYLTKKEISGRDIGTRFQFEDRLGVGLRFGERKQYELGFRFVHFSNFSIGKYNDAINLYTVVFGYWF